MSKKPLHHKRHQIIKSKFFGFSLKRDDNFIRNITISFGTVFVWVGSWWLIEKFIAVGSITSYIVSIMIWIVLLFMIDGDISQLGWVHNPKEDEEDD